MYGEVLHVCLCKIMIPLEQVIHDGEETKAEWTWRDSSEWPIAFVKEQLCKRKKKAEFAWSAKWMS